MADFVTRLCLVVVLSAVSSLSRDLPFSIGGETQRVNVRVQEKRACCESRDKRSADQADSHLLPSALQVRFRTGDEDVRLNLQKNSDLDVRPPVFVMRAGLPLRADVMQAKPGVGFYQDPDTGASFSVRFHDSGSGYLLNGAYFSGNTQYLLTPHYRQTGSGIGDHDVTKMTSDVSLQNDFLDLLSSGSGDSSELGKDNPHDYSDVTNEDARKTTGRDILGSSQAAGSGGGGSDVTQRVRRRRQASQGTFTVELLLVVDYGVYEKWLSRTQGSTEEARKQAAIGNITEYYSFILNGVDLRYAGINANFSIDVSFAGILVFDDPMDTYWSGGRLAVSSPRDLVEASEALEAFRGWALRLGASLPPSDHVMLFTGFNLTYGGSVSNAGLAYLGSACNTDYYFSIVEEYLDFRTVAVAAHELAHSLGARHDMDGNTCLTFDRYIMTSRFRFPTARTAQNPWKFSSCSVQYFSDFIDDLFRNDTNCLVTRDAVTSSVEIQPFLVSLPGQVYPNDQFCQLSEGEGSYICRDKYTEGYDTTCYAGLQCYRPEFDDCDLKLPPDGLACGDKKWCENGTCVFSPQAVSAVDDLCPFGDNPVLLTAGRNCSQRVRMSRADCYEQAFRAQCCDSCAAVRRDDLPGCEFGDRVETCNSLLCATYNHTLVRQNCCETCASGLFAQATRSTDHPLATRPPAATAAARPELSTVSVLDDASAQTGSSFLSFHTYEVPLSSSLPPDQAPEMTMGTAPSLLPRSDQHTGTYKASATSSLPPDKLNEIPKPFTPLLFPPYQPPEVFKAFTRLLPPLDQRPEILKNFTPPLHSPSPQPEILKEFTPPLQSPDPRPEILQVFTPPLQSPDPHPEILKVFTPPLQSPGPRLEILKEFTPPLHTPDLHPEILKEFTPPLQSPDQRPEILKEFTPPLLSPGPHPEILKEFTPPLLSPGPHPEILKEFTPPLQSPDQRPEIQKEFTPPLQTTGQHPEIPKEFTLSLQTPDRPASSQGENTHSPVSTDPPPLLPEVHKFTMSDAPSLTEVEDTYSVPIVTAIYFNESMSTVGVSSDHDETLVFVETTVVMTNSSDRESSLAQPLVTSRTIAFDTATGATTSPGFTGSPEKVTSADRSSTHVETRGTRETTLTGLGKSRDRTITAGPVTLFGLVSSATTTGGWEEDNLALVTAISQGSDPPFPPALTLGPPDVTPLSGTQSVAGWTSLSQSVPGLTSVPDSHSVATFRLDPAVTSALGTTPAPNATSVPWVPGVTSVLSSESIVIAASVPGLTSSPSDASQPVIPASLGASTSRSIMNTDPPITTPSASKDRSSATTETVRPAVTSQGKQDREEKRERGQDKENRVQDADRQKTEGSLVRPTEHRHGGGTPPPSRLRPQPQVGAGQKGRANSRQRESEGSVSMETEVEEDPRGEREGGRAGTISSSEESTLLSRDTSKERQLTPEQLRLGGGLQVQKVLEAGRSNTRSDVTKDQSLSGLINLLLLLQNLKSPDLQLVTSELSALGGDFGDGTFHLPLSKAGAGVKDTNSRSHTQDEKQSTSAVSFQRASLAHSSLTNGDGSRPQRGRVKAGDLSNPAIGQRSPRRQVWMGRRHSNPEAGGSSKRRRRRRSSGSLVALADAVTTFDRHPLLQPLQAMRSEQGPEHVAVSPRDRSEAQSARRQRRDAGSFESSSRDSQQAEAQDHDLAASWRHVPEGRPQQSGTESHLPVPGDEAARDSVYHYDDSEDEHDSADSTDVVIPGQTAFSREDGSDDRNDNDAVALNQGLSRVGSMELEVDRQRNPELDVGGAASDDDETDVSDENDTDTQPDNEDVTVAFGPSAINQHKISDLALGSPPYVTSSSGEEIFQKVPTPDDETVERPGDAADDDSRKDDDRDTYKNTDLTVDEDNDDEKRNKSEADENHKDGEDEDSKDASNDSEGETDQKTVQRHATAMGNANADGNSSSNKTYDKDDDVGGGDSDLENTPGAKTEEPVADSGSVADGQPDPRRDLGEAFITAEPVDDDSFVRSAWPGAGRDSLEDSTLEAVADDQPPEFQAGSIQAKVDDPTERPVSHDRTGLVTDVRAGGSDPPDGDFGRARPPSDPNPDIFTDEGDTVRDTASSGDAMGEDDDDQQLKGQYVAGSYGRFKNIENFDDNNFQPWTPSLPTLQISDRGDNATGSEDVVIFHDDVITGSEGVITHRERAESEQEVTVGGGITREVEANTKSSDADPSTSRRPALAARPLSGGHPGWTAKMADSGVAGRTTYTDNDTHGGGKIHNGSDPERMTPTGGRDSSVINASLDDGVSTYKMSSNGEGMSERLEDLQGRPRRKLSSGNTSHAVRDTVAGRPQDVTSHAGRQPSGKLPARATRLGYSLPRGQAVMAEVTSGPVMTSKTTRKYTASAAAGNDGRAGLTPLQNSVGLTVRSTFKPGHIRVDSKREGTRRGGSLKSSHSL